MDYLEPRFRLLTHPLHPITVRFYPLAPQSMLDRITREGSLSTGHAAGVRKSLTLQVYSPSLSLTEANQFQPGS